MCVRAFACACACVCVRVCVCVCARLLLSSLVVGAVMQYPRGQACTGVSEQFIHVFFFDLENNAKSRPSKKLFWFAGWSILSVFFSTISKVIGVWNRAYFRCFHGAYFFVGFRMIFQTENTKTRKIKKLLSYYKIPCFVRVSLSLSRSLSRSVSTALSLSLFPSLLPIYQGGLTYVVYPLPCPSPWPWLAGLFPGQSVESHFGTNSWPSKKQQKNNPSKN